MFINNPEKFAAWFNEKYPGAYRPISAKDVENLKSCELIHRYRYYSTSEDGKTVMGILKYEQMQQEQSTQNNARPKEELPRCNMCGQPLPIKPEDKGGRPREYCSECESSRNRERQWKLRRRRRKRVRAEHR